MVSSYNFGFFSSYVPSRAFNGISLMGCIKKGIEWFYNGHFLVNSEWKQNWVDKYMGDGTMPIGPSIPDQFQNGDGSVFILSTDAFEVIETCDNYEVDLEEP